MSFSGKLLKDYFPKIIIKIILKIQNYILEIFLKSICNIAIMQFSQYFYFKKLFFL